MSHRGKVTYENSLIACLSSLSSKTLYVCIFSGGTPCRSRTCIAAREKPHWGKSGVPFINSTTGVLSTAAWILALVSCERYLRASETAGGLKIGSREARCSSIERFDQFLNNAIISDGFNIRKCGKLISTWRNKEARWRMECNLRYVTGCWEITPSATTPILPPHVALSNPNRQATYTFQTFQHPFLCLSCWHWESEYLLQHPDYFLCRENISILPVHSIGVSSVKCHQIAHPNEPSRHCTNPQESLLWTDWRFFTSLKD